MRILIHKDQEPTELMDLVTKVNDKYLIRNAIENIMQQYRVTIEFEFVRSNIDLNGLRLVTKLYEDNGGNIASLHNHKKINAILIEMLINDIARKLVQSIIKKAITAASNSNASISQTNCCNLL